MSARLVISEHDQLGGLSDDDHVQYALANKTRPSPWVAAGDLAALSIADLGTKDHDLLDGLGDDDHLQYALANKTRPSPWVAAADLAARSLADLGTRSHADLQNLGSPADDHPQYALADKSRPTPWVAAGDLSGLSIADLGTKDHDLLDGLADDDHVQYLLINGTRAMTGALNMNGNSVVSPDYVYAVGNMGVGGSNIDPFFLFLSPVGTQGTAQIWPTGRTITAAFSPVLDSSASDTFAVAGGTYAAFIRQFRTVTNSLAYNAFAMHTAVFLGNTFSNANTVAANLGLYIAVQDNALQQADAAGITSLGHVTMFANPRLGAINAGSLVHTYVVGMYSAGNLAANTFVQFYIHYWAVNPGGAAVAGSIVNEYAFWIQNFTKATNAYGIYSQLQAGATRWFLFQTAGGAKIQLTGDLGFYGTAPAAQQTVTGSRAGNAALASLLTALAAYGLIIDNTTV